MIGELVKGFRMDWVRILFPSFTRTESRVVSPDLVVSLSFPCGGSPTLFTQSLVGKARVCDKFVEWTIEPSLYIIFRGSSQNNLEAGDCEGLSFTISMSNLYIWIGLKLLMIKNKLAEVTVEMLCPISFTNLP